MQLLHSREALLGGWWAGWGAGEGGRLFTCRYAFIDVRMQSDGAGMKFRHEGNAT